MAAYALRDVFDQQGRSDGSLIFRLFVFATCLLVAIAPIYWLPSVPLPLMTAIKNVAFFCAVGLAILKSGVRFAQPRMAFPFVVAAMLNFLAFQINGSSEYSVYQALNFLTPMAWVMALRSLSYDQTSILFRYLPLPLGLIAIAVAYAFLAKFGAVPDLRPPAEGLQLVERQISGFQYKAVSTVGFHFGRTGWGLGTSMALVLLGSILIGRNRKAFGLLILVLAVLAPAVMGGRGAALSAMAAFALAVLTMRQLGGLRVWLVLTMTVVPVLGIDYLASAGILSERFFNVRSNADWFFMVDEMTTGRLSTWVNAIENFARSPLIGVGVQESLTVRHTGQIVGVHNVWLAFLSEGGLIAFMPAVFIFIWCARIVWQIAEFRPLVVFVTVASMMEPSVVFGTFGNQVAFWTAVGIAMRGKFKCPTNSKWMKARPQVSYSETIGS